MAIHRNRKFPVSCKMASSGRGKNRRIKGKTVDLSSFLGDQKTAPGFAVVNPKLDWADYVEEESEDKYSNYRKEEKQLVLPTAPKAARGPDFDVSKIPSEPPFTAYIGNLPFDITEDEIIRFFGNLIVISVRLPRDGGDRGRMRGFGYAEFDTKQALIEALSLNGETLKNRPVKVSLAGESVDNDKNERKNDGIDRTASDWRAAPKAEDSFGSRNQRNSKYEEQESREPYRGRNSYGEDRGRFDGNRQSYQGRRSADRDRDFFSERDRGFNRRYGDSGFDRDRGNRVDKDDFEFRRDDRGFNRSGRIDKRENLDRDGRDEDQDRGSDRSKDRPRLQLKPRSVPVGEQPLVNPSHSSSIFGGAKPVDTAAKEREIEIRLAKEREKLGDDAGKPKFSSWGDGMDVETTVKKVETRKQPEEPLRENFHTRADGNERSSKERLNFVKSSTHISSSEQENGEPEAFLSNKFAQLSSQDE